MHPNTLAGKSEKAILQCTHSVHCPCWRRPQFWQVAIAPAASKAISLRSVVASRRPLKIMTAVRMQN